MPILSIGLKNKSNRWFVKSLNPASPSKVIYITLDINNNMTLVESLVAVLDYPRPPSATTGIVAVPCVHQSFRLFVPKDVAIITL